MTDTPPNYRRLFWKSRDHLWLAVLTLGLGFATGEPLGLLVGGVLYALGHVYLPDSARFRKKIDARRLAADNAASSERERAFEAQRTQLLASLSAERRRHHQSLVAVCKDITAASAENSSGDLTLSLDTRLRKLDELLWTYLRLQTIEQSLEVYLETERREQLPQAEEAAAREISALEAEIAASPASPSLETRRKLLASRRDRLDALRQRIARIAQARANLDLALSEQERLVEQAKLIRADAVAHKNAESLGARIDISIEHLAETNRWLSELSEFKDLTGQLPALPAGAMVTPSATATRQPEPPLSS
ncbi:hypothetical protein [Rariglobus hedericola]|uniref:Uncharacterized protein n=1 Tax=Rariglobus hedericola TaxID=2597822 RepID=A0A556QJL6_9BACT|nr:hypothetical protein [Rariglobus hedericola]TSJ76836.1 hypothetical protein FPL22_12000 [Rariglobus hedericola]